MLITTFIDLNKIILYIIENIKNIDFSLIKSYNFYHKNLLGAIVGGLFLILHNLNQYCRNKELLGIDNLNYKQVLL